MKATFVLFDGYTALDAVGGYEVLSRIPGMEIEFVARSCGTVAADTRRLGLAAYRTFEDAVETDVLYVPGGPGVSPALLDPVLIDYIRLLDSTSMWTIGICNGVALLGEAGLLEGRRVTTNWSWRERVAQDYRITVVSERYHQDGKVVTSAGVSASIDAALFLTQLIAGDDVARMIQLGLEYYPEPPFADTCDGDVPDELREIVRNYDRDTAAPMLREMKPPFPALPSVEPPGSARATSGTPARTAQRSGEPQR